MVSSTDTILYFGIYVCLVAVSNLVQPDMIVQINHQFGSGQKAGVALTEQDLAAARPFVTLVGVLIAFVGMYYVALGSLKSRKFARLTVYTRLFVVPVVFLALFALGRVSIVMVLGAVPDVLGALWTRAALKAEDKQSTQIGASSSGLRIQTFHLYFFSFRSRRLTDSSFAGNKVKKSA